MTIQIRVIGAQAIAQLRAVQAAEAGASKGTVSWASGLRNSLGVMGKWGSQLQWMGRQITYNFALPIAAAMGLATKFALDNEAAMVRVSKVYGDGTPVFNRLATKELPALAKAFEMLSDEFGVNQAQVINIGADWAAAGASGIALAKATKLTLETMVLGEMDAESATRSLIAIQAQYGLSTSQLSKTIDTLNMVENQTGTTMQDLITGMARAAGTAKTAGVSVRQLAAMMAALVPSTGTAAAAGNSLKTMLTRILSPTTAATAAMSALHKGMSDQAFDALDTVQRLQVLAKGYDKLTSSAKVNFATIVAGRYQVNRFEVLLDALNRQNSYYYKALDATSSRQKIYNQRVKELNQVLTSSPQKMHQVWVVLQNAMADVIIPVIPLIVYLGQTISKLATAFSNLDPRIQKIVLGIGVFLIVFALASRLLGSTMVLFSLLGRTLLEIILLPEKVAGAFMVMTARILILANQIYAIFVTLGELIVAPFVWAFGFLEPLFIGFFSWVGRATIAFGEVFIAIWGVIFDAAATLFIPLLTAWEAVTGAMMGIWVTTVSVFEEILAAGEAGMMTLEEGLVATWILAMSAIELAMEELETAWVGIMAAMDIAWDAMLAGLFAGLGEIGLAIVAAIASIFTPIGLAITAAVLAIVSTVYALRDKLVPAWHAVTTGVMNTIGAPIRAIGQFFVELSNLITKAFWALPASVRNALLTVLNVVKSIAVQIAEWLSYLNPFARHSPSLVDNVKAGAKVVSKHHKQMADSVKQANGPGGNPDSLTAQATSDVQNFTKALAQHGNAGGEFASDLKDLKATIPSLVPAFEKLISELNKLTQVEAKQKAAVDAQQTVVDNWKKKLDQANAILDRQTDKLDKLKDGLQKLQDQYDAAQTAMQNFADAPIQGMQAMSDAIFNNEIAQKKLQLQMMQWQQVNGTIDDLRNKLSLLQGDIETLTGKAQSLREQGAGSDILGPIEDQINALQAQAKAVNNAITNSPISQMQAQMDALQQEGQMLQLQYDIKYDPLTRQIDQLANAQKELSYDDIVKGILAQQAAMAQLQPQIDTQTASVAAQQAVVDELTKKRDALQKVYDKEEKHLEKLQAAYQKTADTISSIRDALQSVTAAASKAGDALSGAGKGGSAAAAAAAADKGTNFPKVGGKSAISREGGLTDQSALIDQFTQQTAEETGKIFGSFDVFAPLKKQWSRAWGWIDDNLGPVGKKINSGITSMFKGAGKGIDAIIPSGGGSKLFSTFADQIDFVKKLVKGLWKAIAPNLDQLGQGFIDFGKNLKDKVWPELVKFKPIVKQMGPMFQNMWKIVKPILEIFAAIVLLAVDIISKALATGIGPALDIVIAILQGFITIVRGILEIIVGLFTLNFRMMEQGVIDIVQGLFKAIGLILWDAAKLIVRLVEGIVEGIVQWFEWLYDKIIGHSIIPDLINGIFAWFGLLATLAQWVWDNVLKPVYDFFVSLWNDHVSPALGAWWAGIKAEWADLKKVAGWVWDNVLKPVWDKVDDLWKTYVGPALGAWWAGIKAEWDAAKKAGQWIWDNVLTPVWNRIQDLWNTYVGPELAAWWGRIKNAWSDFTKVGKWLKDNLMDPLKQAFIDGWGAIDDWFTKNAESILKPISSVVKSIISAIDWIIKGLNKLGSLPGVKLSISEITAPDSFASGGIPRRRVGGGFQTNGARAIVGEGKANYPEFVIPTDPTYRKRALGLMQVAANKMGVGHKGIWGDYSKADLAQILKDNPSKNNPFFDGGGWLGDVGSAFSGALHLGEGILGFDRDVMVKIMSPFFSLAKHEANRIDWSTGKQAADGAIDLSEAWLKGANDAFKSAYDAAQAASKKGKLQKGLDFARSQAGKPYKMTYDAVGPDYYDCSGFMSAVTRAILGQNPHDPRIGSTANFPWPMYGAVTDAMTNAMTIGSTPNYAGTGTGHMAGTLLGVNIESNGDQGVVIGHRGAFTDPNFGTHAQLMLANGGIVRAMTGGVLARLGEGGHDELVAPLPKNWKTSAFGGSDSGSGKTVNIYGNLEFPNITSGADAKTFIENLEDLAG